MQDLYLKFPDQNTADELLYDQVPTQFNSDGDPISYEPRPKYMNTNTLGIIYEGGSWDSEGNEITPPKPLSGWHVNIRLMSGEDASLLVPYQVFPTVPRRVWA